MKQCAAFDVETDTRCENQIEDVIGFCDGHRKTRKIPPRWRLIRHGAEMLHLVHDGTARCGIVILFGIKSRTITRRCHKCERWQDMKLRPPFGRTPNAYHPKRRVEFPVSLRWNGQTLFHESREALRDFLLSNRVTRERVATDRTGWKWRVRLEAVLRGAADL